MQSYAKENAKLRKRKCKVTLRKC